MTNFPFAPSLSLPFTTATVPGGFSPFSAGAGTFAAAGMPGFAAASYGPAPVPAPMLSGGLSGAWRWLSPLTWIAAFRGSATPPPQLPAGSPHKRPDFHPKFDAKSKQATIRGMLPTGKKLARLVADIQAHQDWAVRFEPGFLPEGGEWGVFASAWQQLLPTAGKFRSLKMDFPQRMTIAYGNFPQEAQQGSTIDLGSASLEGAEDLLIHTLPHYGFDMRSPTWWHQMRDNIRFVVPRGTAARLLSRYQQATMHPEGALREAFDEFLQISNREMQLDSASLQQTIGHIKTTIAAEHFQLNARLNLWRFVGPHVTHDQAPARQEMTRALHAIDRWATQWSDILTQALDTLGKGQRSISDIARQLLEGTLTTEMMNAASSVSPVAPRPPRAASAPIPEEGPSEVGRVRDIAAQGMGIRGGTKARNGENGRLVSAPPPRAALLDAQTTAAGQIIPPGSLPVAAAVADDDGEEDATQFDREQMPGWAISRRGSEPTAPTTKLSVDVTPKEPSFPDEIAFAPKGGSGSDADRVNIHLRTVSEPPSTSGEATGVFSLTPRNAGETVSGSSSAEGDTEAFGVRGDEDGDLTLRGGKPDAPAIPPHARATITDEHFDARLLALGRGSEGTVADSFLSDGELELVRPKLVQPLFDALANGNLPDPLNLPLVIGVNKTFDFQTPLGRVQGAIIAGGEEGAWSSGVLPDGTIMSAKTSSGGKEIGMKAGRAQRKQQDGFLAFYLTQANGEIIPIAVIADGVSEPDGGEYAASAWLQGVFFTAHKALMAKRIPTIQELGEGALTILDKQRVLHDLPTGKHTPHSTGTIEMVVRDRLYMAGAGDPMGVQSRVIAGQRHVIRRTDVGKIRFPMGIADTSPLTAQNMRYYEADAQDGDIAEAASDARWETALPKEVFESGSASTREMANKPGTVGMEAYRTPPTRKTLAPIAQMHARVAEIPDAASRIVDTALRRIIQGGRLHDPVQVDASGAVPLPSTGRDSKDNVTSIFIRVGRRTRRRSMVGGQRHPSLEEVK